MKQLDMTEILPRGALRFIASRKGQVFECIGCTANGRPTYCKLGDFDRAAKLVTDELLYVLTEAGEIVPRKEFAE